MKYEEMKPQERVIEYMRRNGAITNNEAVAHLGNGRLSETIRKLRRKGYDIETVMVEGANRYGEPSRYGKYILHENEVSQ